MKSHDRFYTAARDGEELKKQQGVDTSEPVPFLRSMTMPPSSLPDSARIRDLISWAQSGLARAGVPDARREARLLLETACGISPLRQMSAGDEEVGQPDVFTALVLRRAAGEPFAHLSGQQGFWTLTLNVSPATLIPRGDSETLIEALLHHRPGRRAVKSVLDMGTGTGCLLLAALSEYPEAFGVGVERVPEAASLAQNNAVRNGLDDRCAILCGRWDETLEGQFDVVLSNPPYIPTGDIPGLMRDVAEYEPSGALDGGADGLDDYRYLVPALTRLLAPGGIGIFEIGLGQAEAVSDMGRQAGLQVPEVRCDLGGIPRAVVFTR